MTKFISIIFLLPLTSCIFYTPIAHDPDSGIDNLYEQDFPNERYRPDKPTNRNGLHIGKHPFFVDFDAYA